MPLVAQPYCHRSAAYRMFNTMFAPSLQVHLRWQSSAVSSHVWTRAQAGALLAGKASAVPVIMFDGATRFYRMPNRTNFRLLTLIHQPQHGERQHVRWFRRACVHEATYMSRHENRRRSIEEMMLRRFGRVETQIVRTVTTLKQSAGTSHSSSGPRQFPAPCFTVTVPSAEAGLVAPPKALSEMNVERLAQDVMDRIDRRLTAVRERMGRI
jgi:hypothetical protein